LEFRRVLFRSRLRDPRGPGGLRPEGQHHLSGEPPPAPSAASAPPSAGSPDPSAAAPDPRRIATRDRPDPPGVIAWRDGRGRDGGGGALEAWLPAPVRSHTGMTRALGARVRSGASPRPPGLAPWHLRRPAPRTAPCSALRPVSLSAAAPLAAGARTSPAAWIW